MCHCVARKISGGKSDQVVGGQPVDSFCLYCSRRWNRAVSRLFHQVVFIKAIDNNRDKKNDNKSKAASANDGYISQRNIYGLLIFLISGLMHDLMIAAATRNITFELTAFFMIHGIVVSLEAKFRTAKYKKDPTGVNRVVCNLLTVLFFVTTGRLFLGPILRHDEFLRISQQF